MGELSSTVCHSPQRAKRLRLTGAPLFAEKSVGELSLVFLEYF